MDETHDSLLNIVNASGFLFQLRVEHEIEKTYKDHSWSVVAREHHWIDPESKADGYIDMVLEKGIMKIVIECKRLREASWVFLIPEDSKEHVHRARLLWTDIKTEQPNLADWHDFQVAPSSSESAFCVVRGHSDKNKPMLERLCGVVLNSLESLADEESMLKSTPLGIHRVYLPLVVTSAELKMCCFNTVDVDIQKGQLPKSKFQTIPFIRFRKGLTTKIPYGSPPLNLTEANYKKERTVFIVQATKLSEFLKKFTLNKLDDFEDFPWNAARFQEERKHLSHK